jgi:thiol-disulfide isomerase/thioredoxin
MEKMFLLNFALLLTALVNAQTVVEQPRIGMTTASNVRIEKIVLSDTATVFWFNTKATPGNLINIPKKTYLLPVGSKDTLFIKAAEGIPLNKQYIMPSSGEVSYQLTFPKIGPSVGKIDYGEANDGGTWFIYDIRLKPDLYKSMIPEKLSGNWFRGDNAQWEISLLDSAAVYKSKVWKYLKYEEKDGMGILRLKNASKSLSLYTKSGEDGTYMIGETSSKMSKYTHEQDESVIPLDNETFKLPVFKTDTAIYCGYIRNFSARYPQRTGMVYVNDVLAGDQVPYSYRILDNGYFEAKIPHISPQIVMVRHPVGVESVFIEPGKTVFQLIDYSSKSPHILYMGEGARINTDLYRVKDIYSFNYSEMRDKILDFTPEQYKLYCENSQIRDLNKLKDFCQDYRICAKTKKLWNMVLNYRSAEQVLSYKMNFESAYRTKNKIPNTQRENSVMIATPDSSYYSFLTMDFVNDPFAVMTSDYYFFINSLKYLEILRSSNLREPTMTQVAETLQKSGVQLKLQEKELLKRMAEFDSPEIIKIENDFQDKYGKQMTNYMRKYNDKLQFFYKEKRGTITSPFMEEEYLNEQGIQFTDEEKALILAMKERYNNPLIQKKNKFQVEYREQISQFNIDHQEFTYGMYLKRSMKDRNEKLGKLLGIYSGLAIDVMNAQDICKQMAREMTPMPDEIIKAEQKNYTIPFIANYLKVKNDEIKAKIESNKLAAKKGNSKVGFAVKEVPKTAGDKVFETIMANYKGKVVYVDFWATWCAPCLSGIQQMKPLKEELANENVVFLYITNNTSPKLTYDNMIPDIKGEHYRLTADQFNIVGSRYKISGIPHYMLVGKDGRIINEHLSYMENEQLKNLLMKYVKE